MSVSFCLGQPSRADAMVPGDYLNNIAANIVDYADADSTPTVGPGDFPAWRGVEAIAWPNEVFMRFKLGPRSLQGTDYLFKLEMMHFVEFWNLSSKPVSLDPSAWAISNNLDVPLACHNWQGNLATVDPTQKLQWDALRLGIGAVG